MNHYAPASRPSGGSRTFIDWEYFGLETELFLRPRSTAELLRHCATTYRTAHSSLTDQLLMSYGCTYMDKQTDGQTHNQGLGSGLVFQLQNTALADLRIYSAGSVKEFWTLENGPNRV